jgi:hypothetical protein
VLAQVWPPNKAHADCTPENILTHFGPWNGMEWTGATEGCLKPRKARCNSVTQSVVPGPIPESNQVFLVLRGGIHIPTKFFLFNHITSGTGKTKSGTTRRPMSSNEEKFQYKSTWIRHQNPPKPPQRVYVHILVIALSTFVLPYTLWFLL